MLKKIATTLLWIWLFLLPLQTRWIITDPLLQNFAWEYGRVSLYFTDIVFIVLAILTLIIFIKQKNYGQLLNWPFFILLAFVIWAGVSLAWTINPAGYYYFLRLVQVALVVVIFICLRPSLGFIFSALVSAAVIQTGMAFFQFFLDWSPAYKWLGLAEHSAGQLGAAVVENNAGRYLRAYGTFPHPNILGGFLALALVGFTAAICRAKVRLAWWQLVVAAFIFQGLILTFSRSAWIGAAVGIVYFVLANLANKSTLKKIFAIILVAIAVTAVNYFSMPDLLSQRIIGGERLEAMSIAQRQSQINESVDIISRDPFGAGLGGYTVELQRLYPSEPGYFYQPVHNIYLLILAELGYVGFILFALFIITVLIRRQRAGMGLDFYPWGFLAVFLVIGLFDHYFWTSPSGLTLFGIICGGLWAKNAQE